MKVLVGAASLLFAKSLSIICSLVVLALASRKLEHIDLARLALYLSSIALFQPAVRFGLGRALLSRLAGESESDRHSTVYRSAPLLILSMFVAGVIFSIPLIAICCWNAKSATALPFRQFQLEVGLVSLSLVLSGLLQILSDIARGIGRSVSAAFLDSQRGGSVSGLILVIACSILFVRDELTIKTILICTLASYSIPILLTLVISYLGKRHTEPTTTINSESVVVFFKSSLYFWAIDILAAFLLFGDTWLASLVLDADDAMTYYVASQIAATITFPVGLLSVASLTEIVRNYKSGHIKQAEVHARRISAISTIICIPAIGIVLIGSDYFIQDFFGLNSEEAFLPLCLLLASKAVYVVTGPTSLCLAFLLKGNRALLISVVNVIILCSTVLLFAKNSASSFSLCLVVASILQNLMELTICYSVLKIRTYPSLDFVGLIYNRKSIF